MKLKLHHINLSTNNVSRMNDFYKNILLLDTETKDLPVLETKKGYSGDVDFVTDGNIQTHLAEKDLNVSFGLTTNHGNIDANNISNKYEFPRFDTNELKL